MVSEATRMPGGNEGESRYHYGGYYCSPRSELAAHIPPDTKRVLDIGCGAGAFGHSLKQRGVDEVIGIEIDERASALAEEVLDGVLTGDIERMELPFESAYFDCITLGDVLEHLIEPAAALRRLAPFLAPEGVVVASIPNARFCQVVRMLAEGRWKYEDAGILDRTHLRFFTAVEMQLLFQGAGYEILKMQPLSMLPAESLPRNDDGGFTMGRLTIGPLDDVEYQDFLVFQYLVVAKRAPGSPLERARAALTADRFEEACTIAALAGDADPTERNFILGQALGRMGRFAAAEAALREALASSPDRADITGQLGVLLVAMNRHEEAIPCLAQATAADPNDFRALGAWGLALLAAGRLEEAFEKLKASLDVHFDNISLMEPFVSLGESQERWEDLEPVLRRFVEFYPGNSAMALRLARILVLLGKTGEAREHLETVLLFDAGNADASRLLEEIARGGA
jgi:2-polyprenyl-3-methyl-5-hydroxy-6-metoxy-1,4-benzoquinol methylase/Flp pilus assembly protein TadD